MMTREQALALLTALEASGNALGQLVRDTTGFENLRSVLYRRPEPFYHDRNPHDYCIDVFKACPNLQTVDLCFSTEKDLIDLLQALSLTSPFSSCTTLPRRSSDIRSINFWYECDGSSKAAVDFASTFETLSRLPLKSLDELSFCAVHWTHSIANISTAPVFPLPVRSLDLYQVSSSTQSLFPFFPRQTSSLRSLSLEGSTNVIDMDLVALARIVGTNLRELYINFWASRDEASPTNYATVFESPRLPPSAFQTYPLLSSLNLCNTHGPSLALLETLSKSSPLLSAISFAHSRWICSYIPSSSFPAEIFPEDDIIAILKEFLHLKHIHLGYLPTFDPPRYEGMRGKLEARGMKVEYQIWTRE